MTGTESKAVPAHAMQACRRGGGFAPPVLNLSTSYKWVVNFMHRLLYPRGRTTE